MNYRFSLAITLILSVLSACNNQPAKETNNNNSTSTDTTKTTSPAPQDSLAYPGEKHLKNVRQLTFGGDNAEAYFSFAGDMLSYQWTTKDSTLPCDQIFYISTNPPSTQPDAIVLPNGEKRPKPHLVSTGKGRTTCSYFLPGDSLILYASTHLAGDGCPENPHRKNTHGYLWDVFSSYEIFIADLKGNIKKQLTKNKYYDAEATLSPKGDLIVFTSTRSGDLELYTMNLDGSNVEQVTRDQGYDGGAFFSPDGTKLIFRASRPKTAEEINKYRTLLGKELVAPSNMELFVCNVDGSDLKQITSLGNANWAPYFHPSGNKVLFCSNHKSDPKKGIPFNLYMVNVDGTGLEQITFDEEFDSFPMFSPDGKRLVFASNRNNGDTRNTNIFLADWVE